MAKKEDGRIQFRHPITQVRKTICSGLTGKGEVATFKAKIMALVDAVRHGQDADAQTRAWCDGLEPHIREKIANVGLLKYGASIPVTMEAFIDAFLAENVKPISLPKYLVTRKRLLEYFKPDQNVRHLTEGDAWKFSQWVRDSTGNSENTARKNRARFSQMLQWGLDNRILSSNVMKQKRIKTHMTAKSEDKYYTVKQEDALKILAECERQEEWELACYFTILRWGGLRASEPFQLRWSEVDFGAKFLKDYRTQKTAHHFGKATRSTPMFWWSPMEKALMNHYANAKSKGGNDLVFPNLAPKEGGQTSTKTQSVSKRLQRICVAVGITPWADFLRNLRYTAANEVLRNCGKICESKWIGHTERVASIHYTRVQQEEELAAITPPKGAQVEGIATRVTDCVTEGSIFVTQEGVIGGDENEKTLVSKRFHTIGDADQCTGRESNLQPSVS